MSYLIKLTKKILLFISLFFVMSSTAQALVTDGLISYWKFDDGSGNVAVDSIGTNNGEILNGASWTAGKFGQALSFDGVDDFVRITSSVVGGSDLDMTGKPWSLSAWFRWDGNDYSDGMVSFADPQSNVNGLVSANSSNAGKFNIIVDGGTLSGNVGVMCATDPVPNVWYNVIGVWDGSNSYIYLDGNLCATNTNGLTDYNFAGDQFAIGARRPGKTTELWGGQIDDVRLYGKALSASEVGLIYNNDTGSAANYQCSDSVDNDGDGLVDMNDPDCSSSTDDNEATVLDTTPPTPPTNLTATVDSTSQISLAWTASTDSNPITYHIYRDNVNVGNTTSTTYSDTGLTLNTTYSYYVVAVDSSSNQSGNSNSVSATTLAAADTTAPTISNVKTTKVSETTTTLSWSVNEPATSILRYGTSTSYGNTENDNVLKLNPEFALTGLSAGTTYYYSLSSTDSAGNTSEYSGTFETLTPSSIGSSTAVAISMKYNLSKNRQKFIALAAYSDDITYRRASYTDSVIDFGVRYRDAIKQWRLESLPSNGDLYEGYNKITTIPYVVSNPDDLLYVPNKGFVGNDSFEFVVKDSRGTSQLGTITLIVEDAVSVPVGVQGLPAIFNTPTPVPATSGDTETIDWYIDNTHPNATDTPRAGESTPRRGTPDYPRMTIPGSGTTFAPGAKVFIMGGVETPYRLRNSSWHRWTAAGTETDPIYFIGVNDGPNKPIIDTGDRGTQLRLEMQYAIFEGIHYKGRFGQRNQLGVATQGNIVLRHMLIDVENRGTTGSGLSLNTGNNKVVYDVLVRNAGRTEPDLSQENDVHGIQISNVANYWILDSLIHDSAGDATQINGEFARNIYIARNKFHSDNENAMDFKRRYDLMFVENDVWDYRAIAYGSSGSDGTPVIINQDTNGQTPYYSTISRNRIWDANSAIRHQGEYIWTSDNVIWNIHRNVNAPTTRSYAISVGSNTEDNYNDNIVNNTFHKVDGGVFIWAGNQRGVVNHVIKGNIFGELNTTSTDRRHFRISSNHIRGTYIDNNIYMDNLNALWGSSDVYDLAQMRANTTNSQSDLDNTNPMFVNASQFDLRLSTGSPAIDSNIEHNLYSEFSARYSASNRYDNDLIPRPQGGAWDRGAYEYVSGSVVTPTYQCSDSIDNDGDGLTDMSDPGCTSTTDDSETDSGSQTTDTQAPTVPANLTAVANSPSQISLTWSSSTDDTAVEAYRIYRNGTFIATSATNSYTDSSLAENTTYSYMVSAYDQAGNTSTQSAAVSVTTESSANTSGNVDNPTPVVTIDDVSGNENDGPITITATLNVDVSSNFTLDVSSADGTATLGDADYAQISNQTLTFVGNAGEQQTFTLTPIGDTKVEGNETVLISMSNVSNSAININDAAVVTIINDDRARSGSGGGGRGSSTSGSSGDNNYQNSDNLRGDDEEERARHEEEDKRMEENNRKNGDDSEKKKEESFLSQLLDQKTKKTQGELDDLLDLRKCPIFKESYRLGDRGIEVRKIQELLKREGLFAFRVTGFFGPITEKAIKDFQLRYASEILAPWGITSPSGYWYKTTRAKANEIVGCQRVAVNSSVTEENKKQERDNIPNDIENKKQERDNILTQNPVVNQVRKITPQERIEIESKIQVLQKQLAELLTELLRQLSAQANNSNR